jgi:hypothetical protein
MAVPLLRMNPARGGFLGRRSLNRVSRAFVAANIAVTAKRAFCEE